MLHLRRLLLVLAILFAQLATGAHAVEHAAGNWQAFSAHSTLLCLTAHDLGAALPSLVALPPVLSVQLVPASFSAHGRTAFPAPIATQQGPPLF